MWSLLWSLLSYQLRETFQLTENFSHARERGLKCQTAKSRRLRVWNGFMHTKSRRISTTLYIRSSTFMHTRSRVHSRVLASPFRVALLKYSFTYQHPSSKIADSIFVHAKCSFCHLKRVSTPLRAPISTSNQRCVELTLQCYRMTQQTRLVMYVRGIRGYGLNLHTNIGSICDELLHLCGECVLTFFISLNLFKSSQRATVIPAQICIAAQTYRKLSNHILRATLWEKYDCSGREITNFLYVYVYATCLYKFVWMYLYTCLQSKFEIWYIPC